MNIKKNILMTIIMCIIFCFVHRTFGEPNYYFFIAGCLLGIINTMICLED